MAPVNVGLILQGAGRLELRFGPHAAKRKDIDTNALRRWKDFFNTEVHGPAALLFQPERASPEFLRYLEELGERPVVLSRSLALATTPNRDFEEILESLYQRLVPRPTLFRAAPQHGRAAASDRSRNNADS